MYRFYWLIEWFDLYGLFLFFSIGRQFLVLYIILKRLVRKSFFRRSYIWLKCSTTTTTSHILEFSQAKSPNSNRFELRFFMFIGYFFFALQLDTFSTLVHLHISEMCLYVMCCNHTIIIIIIISKHLFFFYLFCWFIWYIIKIYFIYYIE